MTAISRLARLGKDSVIYGFGAVLAKGIAFFTLPVYTRIFSPADYGVIEMMATITSLLSSVLVMGMDSAQSFYFFEQKDHGLKAQAVVVSSILQWRLLWGTVIVGAALCGAPLWNRWFFNGELGFLFFAAAFFGALLAQVLSQSVEIFRLLYRPWSYISVTLGQTLLNVAFALFLIVVLRSGIVGFFVGSAIASFLLACWSWSRVREYVDFSRLHTVWWPRLLRFGAPLLPGGLAFYVMSTADRWFIQHYHDATELGLYAIASKFALLMALLIETFRKAWWPIAMDAMHSEDGPQTFRMIARLFMGVGIAGIIALTFIVPWLLRLLTTPGYFSAWRMTGVLAWQSLFYGFFLVGSAGIWKAEKTWITSLLMISSALVNILLNYLLVPPYAGLGAALATAVTFLLWTLASMWLSELYWPVGFDMRVFFLQIALGGAAVCWLVISESRTAVEFFGALAALLIVLASALERQDWLKVRRRVAGLFGKVS